MGIPDSWYEDPHWQCGNGHVSTRYLKSEEHGAVCLACGKPVCLIEPGTKEVSMAGTCKFEKIKEHTRDFPESEDWDWDKPSMAVVAKGMQQSGCIIWCAGPIWVYWADEVGSYDLADLGLDDAPDDGISIWSGKLIDTSSWTDSGYEYDAELVGEFRDPTPEEWTAICKNECPWDDRDWIPDPEKKKLLDLDFSPT